MSDKGPGPAQGVVDVSLSLSDVSLSA
jgi:hypothetical protein